MYRLLPPHPQISQAYEQEIADTAIIINKILFTEINYKLKKLCSMSNRSWDTTI